MVLTVSPDMPQALDPMHHGTVSRRAWTLGIRPAPRVRGDGMRCTALVCLEAVTTEDGWEGSTGPTRGNQPHGETDPTDRLQGHRVRAQVSPGGEKESWPAPRQPRRSPAGRGQVCVSVSLSSGQKEASSPISPSQCRLLAAHLRLPGVTGRRQVPAPPSVALVILIESQQTERFLRALLAKGLPNCVHLAGQACSQRPGFVWCF